jgi:hypothetical protein
MTDESKNFIQMAIFSHRAFDYHLHLKLGYISMPQVNIHCVGNHLSSWFFEILDFWLPDARRTFIEACRSFFQARRTLFLDERRAFVRRVALIFPMGNTWVPNGRRTRIRCVTLYLSQNKK